MSVYKMYEKVKGTPQWDKTMDMMIKCFDNVLTDMKEMHPDKYKEIKNKLYIAINGYHFNEEMLDDTYRNMVSDDGSKVPRWSLSDTTQWARNSGISFRNFNEYDWNYVMNMLYSDYCVVLGDNSMSYVKMAEKFLNDKDAPDGKALRYSMCMKKDYSFE